MKTLLIGNFGSGNIGDELILASALREYPDAVVMTADADFSQKFCGKKFQTMPFPPTGVRSALRWVFSKKYREMLNRVQHDKEIKRIVFPGGGLFAIKFQACFLWRMVFRWAQKLGCPIELLHQGVDEHLGFFSQLNTKFVLSRAAQITVRDDSSARAVKAICGKDVENQQDNLQSSISNLQLEKGQGTRDKGQILLNARARFDLKILDSRLRENDKMVFVAFDRLDLKCVPQDFSGEVVYPQTEKQVFDLFQKAECSVGERFHFLLLGAHFCGENHTFTLREPYAEKVKNFCSACGIKVFHPESA